MNLRTIASQYQLPLHDLVTDDLPYHFGEAGLTVESGVERRSDALVIRHRLINRTAQPSLPVNNPQLLRLTLRHPGLCWELLCARGGTTESYYPPQAYETRRIAALDTWRAPQLSAVAQDFLESGQACGGLR